MSAKYRYRGYSISNKGYYQPDHHVWWEAIDEKTGEASYHGKTRREVMQMIDGDFVRDELKAKLPCNMLKMREALALCLSQLEIIEKEWSYVVSPGGAINPHNKRNTLARKVQHMLGAINSALAEPPRNCDVGTAKEQEERFGKFCSRLRGGICLRCTVPPVKRECALSWGQLPYEAAKEGSKK